MSLMDPKTPAQNEVDNYDIPCAQRANEGAEQDGVHVQVLWAGDKLFMIHGKEKLIAIKC